LARQLYIETVQIVAHKDNPDSGRVFYGIGCIDGMSGFDAVPPTVGIQMNGIRIMTGHLTENVVA
jgi:hypothetical protein